jgi:hypothetical protein
MTPVEKLSVASNRSVLLGKAALTENVPVGC